MARIADSTGSVAVEPLWTPSVEPVRGQDAGAFALLIDRHKGAVFSVAFCVTGDVGASEDIAQEAFLRAWKGRSKLRDPARFRAWVCGIARNIARNENRQRARVTPGFELEAELADPSAGPLDLAMDRQAREVLWSALRAIPARNREVLALYYREGQSAREVASALDVTEAVVLQRLRRGRGQLKAEVARLVERGLSQLGPRAGFVAGVISCACAVGSVGAASAQLPAGASMTGKGLWFAMKTKLGIAVGLGLAMVALLAVWSQSRGSAELATPSLTTAVPAGAGAATSRLSDKPEALPPASPRSLHRLGSTAPLGSTTQTPGSRDGVQAHSDSDAKRKRWEISVEGIQDDGTLWYKLQLGLPECLHVSLHEGEQLDGAQNFGDLPVRIQLWFAAEHNGTRLERATLAGEGGARVSGAAVERCLQERLGAVVFPAGLTELSVSLTPSSGVADAPVDEELLRALPVVLGPSRGPDEARVTVTVYTDFQCGFCARALATLDQLRDEYPSDVRTVTKLFPLKPSSRMLALASVAAGEQGAFWPMHDLIFAYQDQAALTEQDLEQFARQIGIDVARFRSDIASDATAERLQADIDEGKALGVRGTPTLLVNEQRVVGAQPVELFRELIEAELARLR